MSTRPKLYAVPSGRVVGIYNSWAKASSQVLGFRNGVCKSCSSLEAAKRFMLEGGISPPYLLDLGTESSAQSSALTSTHEPLPAPQPSPQVAPASDANMPPSTTPTPILLPVPYGRQEPPALAASQLAPIIPPAFDMISDQTVPVLPPDHGRILDPPALPALQSAPVLPPNPVGSPEPPALLTPHEGPPEPPASLTPQPAPAPHPGREGSQELLAIATPPPPAQPQPASSPLPPLETLLSLRLSTLKHVPKACRRQWADCLTGAVREVVVSPTSVSAWAKLFFFPKAILHPPPRGGAAQWKRLGSTVAARLKRWADGDVFGLWVNARDAATQQAGRKHPSSTQDENSLRRSNARRCRTAVGEGQIKKGVNCLLSKGLGDQSSEVLAEMLEKHPRGSLPQPRPDTPLPAIISPTHLERALKSFPTSSAPGPSGLRPTHLKEAVFEKGHTNGDRAATALLDFCRSMAAGNLPAEFARFFCGGTLLAAKKKDGSHRPISVGEVLRRLVGKCLSFSVRQSATETLVPLQVGVGVPNGCEAIVHAAGMLLEDSQIAPDHKWALAVDWSNAFNTINRQAMFHEIRRRAPGLAAWVESAYSVAPFLRFGAHQPITSEVGIQQGDPLGPLIFSLTLHPLVEKINREVPGLKLNAWYLDDGTMMGSPTHLAEALRIVEEFGPSIGLQMNRAKTVLFIPEGGNQNLNCLPLDLPVSTAGLFLLGAPVGSGHHIRQELTKRVDKTLVALARLPDLEDPHIEATLLRHSLSFPRINYALRTCPPYAVSEALAQYDEGVREALATLVGSPFPHGLGEKQASPPP